MTICLCFPFRPYGISTCDVVLKFTAAFLVLIRDLLRRNATLNKRDALVIHRDTIMQAQNRSVKTRLANVIATSSRTTHKSQ